MYNSSKKIACLYSNSSVGQASIDDTSISEYVGRGANKPDMMSDLSTDSKVLY